MNPMLAIKFTPVSAYDEIGETWPCTLCGAERPIHESSPGVFVAGTWQPVCDDCARREDPSLFARLWRIRAELDRGTIGSETEAWLYSIEDPGADLVREDVEHYLEWSR